MTAEYLGAHKFATTPLGFKVDQACTPGLTGIKSIGDTSFTEVTWDKAFNDPYSMWDQADKSKINIPASDIYYVATGATFSHDASTTDVWAAVTINSGAATAARYIQATSRDVGESSFVSALVPLSSRVSRPALLL